jgi:two-component system response regulator RegX3
VSPRILVVDDEAPLVETLTYALEREHFDVAVARDGAEAIESALSQSFDLVILDLMLPKVSGIDVCRRIRAESDVPIVMLTAKDSSTDLIVGLEVGADYYVTKPFNTAELLTRIRAALRRRELDRGASETLVRRAGGVRVDLTRAEASVDGRIVALTPSEFKILALLASAPGVTFTRRQILEHLWGSPHVGDEHTCEVHVSSLRRKLEPQPGAPKRIVTVRGSGYKLVPV